MPKKIKENALTREGKMMTVLLNKAEMDYLDLESVKMGLSKGYLIRQMIKKQIEKTKSNN